MEFINKKNQQAADQISDSDALAFATEHLNAIKHLMASIENYKSNNDDSSVYWECDLCNMLFGKEAL